LVKVHVVICLWGRGCSTRCGGPELQYRAYFGHNIQDQVV